MMAMLGAVSNLWADDEKSLIVAGERIGQVRLKMDNAKLDLGKPTDSDQAMGNATETYCSKSADGEKQETTIFIRAADENRKHWQVMKVLVTSPFFHTSAGVSTRSEPDALWKEFPDLQYVEEDEPRLLNGKPIEFYDSVANGIGFIIEREAHPAPGKPWGQCRAIIVFSRGDNIEMPTLGGCQSK